MDIQGKNFIGYQLSAEREKTFNAYAPATDTFLPEPFHAASPEEVDRTMKLAASAFVSYSEISPLRRADFLIAITREIGNLGTQLLERAHLETGLPLPRLEGERARTINQLTQFAEMLREGSWQQATIDTAIPDRSPVPKPDIRKMLIPIGPVVVFGSSNFPFAYSVAGVDAGPALAAGNPVIVKAHAAHPGVSDLTAQAIVKAAKACNMPEGVFSMLYDDGFEVGAALVKHQETSAVGFTGSFKGGMALHKLAQERKDPIPVFAEMGSVNPIVILPEYLQNNASEVAKTIAGSVTLGAGQFCTNPGLVFVTQSEALGTFETTYRSEVEKTSAATMLTSGICKNYNKLLENVTSQEDVEILALSDQSAGLENEAFASIARASGKAFIANPELHEEVFGPFSLLVVCEDLAQLHEAISKLPGQLTASLMGSEEEIVANPVMLKSLSAIAGRVIINGVPTGVEVCASMHHGGPFPATIDSQFTSVGIHSVLRFVRPQSFQNWPDSLLPEPLKNANPSNILRFVNGVWTEKPV